jgi:hypothetical protein
MARYSLNAGTGCLLPGSASLSSFPQPWWGRADVPWPALVSRDEPMSVPSSSSAPLPTPFFFLFLSALGRWQPWRWPLLHADAPCSSSLYRKHPSSLLSVRRRSPHGALKRLASSTWPEISSSKLAACPRWSRAASIPRRYPPSPRQPSSFLVELSSCPSRLFPSRFRALSLVQQHCCGVSSSHSSSASNRVCAAHPRRCRNPW